MDAEAGGARDRELRWQLRAQRRVPHGLAVEPGTLAMLALHLVLLLADIVATVFVAPHPLHAVDLAAERDVPPLLCRHAASPRRGLALRGPHQTAPLPLLGKWLEDCWLLWIALFISLFVLDWWCCRTCSTVVDCPAATGHPSLYVGNAKIKVQMEAPLATVLNPLFLLGGAVE